MKFERDFVKLCWNPNSFKKEVCRLKTNIKYISINFLPHIMVYENMKIIFDNYENETFNERFPVNRTIFEYLIVILDGNGCFV